MAEAQTQHRALSNLQARPDLARTGFPQFSRLPQEIQNSIWEEALQAEAQKIVLHDYENGGIYLSQDLISSISRANSAAYAVATEFYNVQLDVFACDLEYSSLSRLQRDPRGVVRLNLDYATLMVGFDPRDLLHEDGWWNIGLPEDSESLQNKLSKAIYEADVDEVFIEHYHIWANGGRPCSDDVPGWVTNCHLTRGLTESERAQVRRTVQVIGASSEVLRTFLQPHCCWNCEFSRSGQGEDLTCSGDFPNVEFCRLLMTARWRDRGCGAYTVDRLINDCANLTTADWWDSIKSRLMLCAKHENLDGEDTADEDIDNATIDNADEHAIHEFDAADEDTVSEDDAEENNVGKEFAFICARKDKSFFF